MQALKSRLDGHFVACSALAAAAAVGGVASTADASIVYSGVVNLPIALTTNGLYLNVVTGQINEPGNTGGSTVPGWDVNPWSSSALNFFSPSTPSGGVYVQTGTNTANLAAGTTIDGSSTYGSGSASTTSALPFVLNSSNNLVGFRFQNEAAGNQVQYGWFRVSLSSSLSSSPRLLVEYAYENSGAGIAAGAVPAPGSLALLALGAAGMVGRRRK